MNWSFFARCFTKLAFLRSEPLHKIQVIASALTCIILHPGEVLIKKGTTVTAGAFFIIGEEGQFARNDSGEGIIPEYTVLCENLIFDPGYKPTETILCKGEEPGKVWAMSRLLYQSTLMHFAQETLTRKRKLVSRVPLLSTLPMQTQKTLAQLLVKRTFPAGEYIIRQREACDSIFFVVSGTVIVRQHSRANAEPVDVNRHKAGSFFGEGALIASTERSADCIAGPKGSVCMELSSDDFRSHCGSLQDVVSQQSRVRTLMCIPLFQSLSIFDLEEIASVASCPEFTKGEVIVCEGDDSSNDMFIIQSGEVKFVREGVGVVGRFFPNEIFGEASLFHSGAKGAQLRLQTLENVKCLCLLCATAFHGLCNPTLAKVLRERWERRSAQDSGGGSSAFIPSELCGLRVLGSGNLTERSFLFAQN